ncbi:hypothetical protein [Streptomyces virginiae]
MVQRLRPVLVGFCFATSQDLATFFDCHRQAFAHFGGVPMSIRSR